jgi:hypothetical protein
MTHVGSWTQAIHGLLAALDGRRAGRRVVGIAMLQLVVDDDGATAVVLQHGVASGLAVAPGVLLREFAGALLQAAEEQEAAVQ